MSRRGHTKNQSSHNVSSSQKVSQAGNDPFDMTSTLASLPDSSDRIRPDQELSAIRIRRLPFDYDHAQLKSLLTFADKLEGADFVETSSRDNRTKTAIARFFSASAAQQASSILQGKQIDPEMPRLIIEVLHLSPGSIGSERHNFDSTSARAQPVSSSGSQSRYNGQFQAMSRVTPPGVNDFAVPGTISDRDALPSAANYLPGGMEGLPRMTGREVIGQEGFDDTNDLLRDSIAHATTGLSRRSTGSSQSIPKYGSGLSLNTTSHTSPPMSGYASPRNPGLQSPGVNVQPQQYQSRHPQFPRTNLPPVNPADQNPPCNTLYVGNLPIDTSEDELKAMFSKQRGYKRLCFRTKQNGPMCFVEFEDVSFATKALNDLYGHPLHNSAHRGGIRLSFSKNPLGVRSGQPGGVGGPSTPLSPSGPMSSANGPGMPGFSTAAGPPPGIPTPPGLPSFGSSSSLSSGAMLGPGGISYGAPPNSAVRGPPISPGTPVLGYGMGDIGGPMGTPPPNSMPAYQGPGPGSLKSDGSYGGAFSGGR